MNRRLLLFVLCALALLRGAWADEPADAPLRLPAMPLHDPYVLAHQPTRTYYLYTSNDPRLSGTPSVGTMAYRSRDLRHWEKPRTVFVVPPGAFAQRGAWAPEVHEYKGRFYLFTTLFNEKKAIAEPPAVPLRTYVRGTVVAASDSPDGPFTMLNEQAPLPPADRMTLDGTLYVDPASKPWLVYAHEWIQTIDGTMEAVPLKDDLSAASGPPVLLFKASTAPWTKSNFGANPAVQTNVTDGPELFRSRDGHLLMLWSSYEHGSYVQTIARSKSGQLAGPWEQLPPLVKEDSGHGMLFHTFEGPLMLVLHRPFKNARGKLYEVTDQGDHLELGKERTDLDGE